MTRRSGWDWGSVGVPSDRRLLGLAGWYRRVLGGEGRGVGAGVDMGVARTLRSSMEASGADGSG